MGPNHLSSENNFLDFDVSRYRDHNLQTELGKTSFEVFSLMDWKTATDFPKPCTLLSSTRTQLNASRRFISSASVSALAYPHLRQPVDDRLHRPHSVCFHRHHHSDDRLVGCAVSHRRLCCHHRRHPPAYVQLSESRPYADVGLMLRDEEGA